LDLFSNTLQAAQRCGFSAEEDAAACRGYRPVVSLERAAALASGALDAIPAGVGDRKQTWALA